MSSSRMRTPDEPWRSVSLGEICRDRREWISVADEEIYTRVTTRIRNQGVELRDKTPGRDIKTKRQQLIRVGDLLVAEIDAKVGGIGIVPGSLDGAVVSSHYFVFEPDTRQVDTSWLDQVCRAGMLQDQVMAVGSTNYAAIRRPQVHEFRICLPPISEQRRIAGVLAAVDEVIQSTQAVIAQLHVGRRALIADLLVRGVRGRNTRFRQTEVGEIPESWRVTTIGDLATFSGGNGFTPKDWAPKGLPIIRIQNLNGSANFNFYDGQPRPEWLVEAGTLLFAWAGSRGASFGPCIWPGPRGVLNQHIFRIVAKDAVLRDYLFYLLRNITNDVEKRAHGFKDTLVHLRKKELTEWRVALPPKDEQLEVLAALQSLTDRIDAEVRYIDALRHAQAGLARTLLADETHGGLDTEPK